jgi:hypothetical protein
VVDDVVAVRAAGPGVEVGGEVAVGDPQRIEVIDHSRDIVEPEPAVDLEPVRGGRPS